MSIVSGKSSLKFYSESQLLAFLIVGTNILLRLNPSFARQQNRSLRSTYMKRLHNWHQNPDQSGVILSQLS